MKHITTGLLVLALAGCDLSLDVGSKQQKAAKLEVIDIYCRNQNLGMNKFGYEIVIDEAREKAIVWVMAYELSDNKWHGKWISHELLDVFVGNQRILLTGKDSRLMLTAANDLSFPDIDYNLQREPGGLGLTCRKADEIIFQWDDYHRLKESKSFRGEAELEALLRPIIGTPQEADGWF